MVFPVNNLSVVYKILRLKAFRVGAKCHVYRENDSMQNVIRLYQR